MKNTNSARGLFYIPSSCFYSERDTHTELVLVSLCRVVISAFHELYKVCLDKDVNILHLSDINSFSFGKSKANSTWTIGPHALRPKRGEEVRSRLKCRNI